ncbi:MAG: peptidyl-prolyl cis-trans isomerase [Rickettsiales bacterium]
MRFLFMILMLGVTFSSARAEESSYRIAAVVNDEVVTMMDVKERLKLIIGTTGLSDTEETRKQLIPRVVRSLIEERLQMQEAASNNITVSEKEVDAAVATIERQRGKAPGSLATFLEENNVPIEAFREQLRVQIAWSKLMSKRIRPRVKVTDADVTREIQRRQFQKQTVDEIQLSSVLLPVDTPENEPSTKALAEKLRGELNKGASFEAVASQLGGQAQNANAIWVNTTDLDPAVAAQIKDMQPGTISPVIRTAAGYQIVRLMNRRTSAGAPSVDAEILLKQILMRLKDDAESQEVDALLDIAGDVAKHPGSCSDKTVAGVENLKDLSFDVTQVRTKLSDMSPELLPFVAPLHVGEVSRPFASKEGIRILMLCERIDHPATKADRDKIRSELMNERLGLETLKYIRNLKREAFVEIRL